MKSFLFLVTFAGAWLAHSGFSADLTRDQQDFFENKIRPILGDRCYKCHSTLAEKIKGGLLLDSREAL